MREKKGHRPLRKPLKSGQVSQRPEERKLSASLKTNIELVKQVLGSSGDIVYREFEISRYHTRAAVIYGDGLVQTAQINDHLLKSLMIDQPQVEIKEKVPDIARSLELVKQRGLTVAEVSETDTIQGVIEAVLAADAVFLLDGHAGAVLVSAKNWPTRGIQEPATETLIRGPREGFTETLRINTALLRRRLKDPNLRLEQRKLGRRSHTDLVIAYIEGIVSADLLQEVKQRLDTIDIDVVLESGYLEQLIEDSYLSPFPQVQNSERPDKVTSALLEGRVALMLDGTPFALIVPATFTMFFQSPEDYYERWIIGSLTRLLRIGASYLATFTPAIYVALVSFHPGLIPTPLALSIAASREGVPFPAVVEALIMEVAFELFREAGARLPRPIGQTVGVVGGLIVGDAAVNARLASPAMLIVVAMTAIAAFSIPSYNMAIGFRMIRFPVTLAAAVFGLYGVALGFLVVNIHMVSMKSFGVVYLEPLIPYRFRDWKDLLLRAPIRSLTTRPEIFNTQDSTRQENEKWEGW